MQYLIENKIKEIIYRNFFLSCRFVAAKLAAGKSVEPEAFAEASIYFSDIVGFTTIAVLSSPLEVDKVLF